MISFYTFRVDANLNGITTYKEIRVLKSKKHLLLGCSMVFAASTAAMAGGAVMPVNPCAKTGNGVYAFGGYYLSHSFYRDDTLTSGGVNYKAANVAPHNLSGVEVGLGKELTRHVALEIAYLHAFAKSRSNTVSGTPGRVKLSGMGVAFDGLYTFNPDSCFQVSAKLGVSVVDSHSEVTGYGLAATAVTDVTHVNPLIGMKFEYRFNEKYSMYANVKYVIPSYQANTQPTPDGGLGLGLGVQYYFHA